MVNCLHCGKCCHNYGQKCRYLAGNLCRVYKKRIGVWTGIRDNKGDKVYCDYRKNDPRIIEGCPLNNEKNN